MAKGRERPMNGRRVIVESACIILCLALLSAIVTLLALAKASQGDSVLLQCAIALSVSFPATAIVQRLQKNCIKDGGPSLCIFVGYWVSPMLLVVIYLMLNPSVIIIVPVRIGLFSAFSYFIYSAVLLILYRLNWPLLEDARATVRSRRLIWCAILIVGARMLIAMQQVDNAGRAIWLQLGEIAFIVGLSLAVTSECIAVIASDNSVHMAIGALFCASAWLGASICTRGFDTYYPRIGGVINEETQLCGYGIVLCTYGKRIWCKYLPR